MEHILLVKVSVVSVMLTSSTLPLTVLWMMLLIMLLLLRHLARRLREVPGHAELHHLKQQLDFRTQKTQPTFRLVDIDCEIAILKI